MEAPEGDKPAELLAFEETLLTFTERRFVDEYVIDRNGTKAYLRVNKDVTEGSAATLSSRLLRKVEVQRAIFAAMEASSVRTGITADMVLQEAFRIVTADARELIEYQVGACRCCWGIDNKFQRTQTEMDSDRAKHEEVQAALQEEDVSYRYAEFDEKGGIGFDPRKEPNPECMECWGNGKGRPVVKDTRRLSKEAAALYAGVKMTKDGLEVKMHSKEAFAEKLAKHLGIYEKDNKQAGEGLAHGLGALLKAMKRSSLPVVAEPDA